MNIDLNICKCMCMYKWRSILEETFIWTDRVDETMLKDSLIKFLKSTGKDGLQEIMFFKNGS
jgi:hypothetical protein